MDYENYRIAAYLVVIMFGAALNAKFLGPSIVAAIAISTSNTLDSSNFVFVFYLSTLLLAGFRE